MTDDWTPITETELLLRIREEEQQLSPAERQNFATWRVPSGTRGTVANFNTDGVEAVFIVARRGTMVVFFDDIEDEFASGHVDDQGAISNPGLFGDLRWALRSLESHRRIAGGQ